ncbi:MAG: response regulator [Gammaproteobacteria bacterium]|nr:response regulator [Gammaproteobacteria bacterium]
MADTLHTTGLHRSSSVLEDRVDLLYGSVPVAVGGTLILAVLLAMVQWPLLPATEVLLWLGVMAASIAWRAGAWLAYRRAQATRRTDPEAWLLQFRAATLSGGLGWALASALMFPPGEVAHQVFLGFVIAGVGAAASTSLSVDRLALAALIGPAALALTVAYLLEGGAIPTAMSVMSAMFLVYVVLSGNRIREQFQQTTALREQLRVILDAVPALVFYKDHQNRILGLNRMAAASLKRPAHELVGRSLDELVPESEAYAYLAEDREILASGQPRLGALKSYRGHGQRERTIRYDKVPLRGVDGRFDRLVAVATDITEQVMRERALAEITAALEAANDCIFMFDAETLRIVYANQGARQHIGYDAGTLASMTPMDINPQYDEAQIRALTIPLQQDPGESFVFRTIHRHRDGHDIPVEVSLQYVPGSGAGRFIGIVRDIRARLEQEASLEKARREAEAASQAKSEFLANMSHEIRTPMTAILGFAELLDPDGEDDRLTGEDAAVALRTIRRHARHLLTVLDDILDVSKIEAGRLRLERLAVDPRALAEETAAMIEARAREKGLELHVEIAAQTPAHMCCDPTRLRQILLNLLSNAVKFTAHGSVTLRLTAPAADRVAFSVIDTGIGMNAEALETTRRFEAFSQADSSTTRRFGGTGLGLRISHALARLLGGALAIESVVDQGSTFTLTLPVNAEEVTAPAPTPAAQASGDDIHRANSAREASVTRRPAAASLADVRVLLAEDGPDNQRLISFHLERAGARVSVAGNGLLAVQQIEAADADSRPDVVLMDMQMPELDGYGATRRLREQGFTGPIIAVTAHAMSGDRERCLAAGCDDYLTKPIDRGLLIATVQRHAATLERSAAEPVSAHTAA